MLKAKVDPTSGHSGNGSDHFPRRVQTAVCPNRARQQPVIHHGIVSYSEIRVA
jgi:hypothetical protein